MYIDRKSLLPMTLVMLGILVLWSPTKISAGDAAIKNITLLTVKGAIGPATSDYLVRGLNQAQQQSAGMILVEMDTPGGLDKSMRDIIQAILQSDIPVVTYVAPQGARAASAGTYILYASHVAAMAPATNLGAATPVQIGAPTPPAPTKPGSGEKNDKESTGDSQGDPGSTLERKQINDSVAYIRGLAELRGRNVEWAERAVRSAESLSAEKALELAVIDLVASDRDELIAGLEGRRISVKNREMTLTFDTPLVTPINPDWRNEFLAVITDPNVAYILMLVGVYGLILEFYNPGMGAPGIIGAICLFIALYAFQVLPISYAGMSLILLGIGLIVAEALMPSFGILGIGGVIAFVFGSIILMDTDLPAYRIALPVVAALAVLSILVLLVIVRLLLRSRTQKLVTGIETLIGEIVEVVSFADGEGKVRLHGELWNARASEPLAQGQNARVVNVKGLELAVEPEENKP